MRRAAGPGDDDFQAVGPRRLGIVDQPVRRAVGADDPGFERHIERRQRFGRRLHGRPVRLAAHDDPDDRLARTMFQFACHLFVLSRPAHRKARVIAIFPGLTSTRPALAARTGNW